jgi:diphosphomevalonate decarboxylase
MSETLKVTWTSPSNIALIKYWGKFGAQMPQNPSISFSLKHSVTTLSIEATPCESFSLTFLFEGRPNEKFQDKIQKFLITEELRFPWLKKFHLKIESANTFPHSSGIASSASSMSALALCLLSLDEKITKKIFEKKDFFKIASSLARLASGSAARSVYKGMAVWGECPELPGSSNLFAINFSEAHSTFLDYCDSILIVDAKEKSVSSRAGHTLMEKHPLAEARYKMARKNMAELLLALKSGDVESFMTIVEEEALTLHALMMSSRPSFILLKPMSLFLFEEIKKFRMRTTIPVCFTIDAGPNIHLLYPKVHSKEVRAWIEETLALQVSGLLWIHDEVDEGPR